jgi:uncharacterized low-complexity protein
MTEQHTEQKEESCDKEKKAEGSCSTEKSANDKKEKEGSCGCG